MSNWIIKKDPVGGNCCTCSECGWFDWMNHRYPYCPYCGTKMEYSKEPPLLSGHFLKDQHE